MSHETGPGQNQKKQSPRKCYSTRILYYNTSLTLFMTGQKADWFII